VANDGETGIFQVRFSNLLQMKLQQKTSKLRGKTLESMETGAKQASPIQFVGAVASNVVTGRLEPINATPHSYTRRWLVPIDKELPQYVDTFDQLKTAIDPKSQLVSSAASAFARDWDDEIIRAATATSTIGADTGSLTTENFDTTNYQIGGGFGTASVATPVGLTVAKLNEAYRIFEHNHIDPKEEGVTLVIGSKQHADLKNQALVTSSDFNRNGGVLVNGYVTQFMGFEIVVSERLPIITDKDSNATQRGCLAFVKSGIHLGMWKDISTQIDQRKDLKGLPWQIYSMHSYGATRTELGRVIQIACADSTGADTTP
jgi:hypothetical protein